MIATPLTQEIADDIVAQIELELDQEIPILLKAFTHVLAKVLAAKQVILYKFGGWIYLQQYVQYASDKETVINGRKTSPLREWGRLIGVGDPLFATQAELTVRVTVKNQTGSLAGGTQLLFASTQVVYQTVAAVPLNAATVNVTIRAVSDPDGNAGAGSIGNLLPGDVVSLANAPANVATDAVVVAQVVAGEDAEDPETYRARVLERFQKRPQGGAYADYVAWGREPAGIANIYPYTGAPGYVEVYVEATEESSGSVDGIPTSGQLAAVAAAIELDVSGRASRRPAGTRVNVHAIVRKAYDVTVTGLSGPDIPAAQVTIQQAVDELFRSREPFIVGLSVYPRLDRVTTPGVSGIVEDAANSVGATLTTVTLTVGGSPVVADLLGPGEKAKLGVMTFL